MDGDAFSSSYYSHAAFAFPFSSEENALEIDFISPMILKLHTYININKL